MAAGTEGLSACTDNSDNSELSTGRCTVGEGERGSARGVCPREFLAVEQ